MTIQQIKEMKTHFFRCRNNSISQDRVTVCGLDESQRKFKITNNPGEVSCKKCLLSLKIAQ